MSSSISFPGKVVLTTNLLVIAALGFVLSGHQVPPFAPYAWLKAMHIVGVVIMVGNVTVGPAWLILALRTKDPATIRFAFRALGLMDVFFTAPGVALLAIAGLSMASAHGGVTAQAWIHQSAWIMIGVALFGSVVLYFQERMIHAAEASSSQLIKWYVWWSIFGSAIGLPMLLVFWMMVSKQPIL